MLLNSALPILCTICFHQPIDGSTSIITALFVPLNHPGETIMKKITVVLASLLISACASTPAPKTDSTQQPDSAKTTVPGSEAVSATASEADKLTAETQELQKQSVYFDFDTFVVKPEYRDVMDKQAAFLKNHKNDVVTLEGNTDERGSSEYNLALGSKRANAVKVSLKVMGVPVAQMKESSFGEVKPRLTCHEEECWKENRRVDFVHQLN
jgi:peptidoglycan-associated lipoprotein